ncbi:Rec8 like protein-domain-containing protein [Chaetomium sp. MPI-SDFR-AT-0129]|uniref:Rec8 like protein-domain-containing protein n=1 Tax=Dichotomopilus funicola TaxID=1934379 RepID=A0AAN6VAT8_9PEZI|nr:Rec8 like protein-domain-containing protein [Chaetomium sp. MPI-SDFR-AT-0129]KAK4147910.1 Rec8 like protein-domain-containing protein [Dichotomopilus funicola]
MFWSGTLLSATGPLAKAWLSANQERKISKVQILQHNLQDSVDAIIAPNDAPLALRLSGQLLLGVVRIYSRKARYLLDDCNEALIKIKMAFRSTGNHDIPTNLHATTKESLMLPDTITPYDNLDLLPPPSSDFLASQLEEVTATPISSRKAAVRPSNRDINLQEDFNNSQFLQDTTGDDDELALANMDDLDLELDFGMDIDDRPTKLMDRSVEMGRDAPAARPVEEDMFSELDVGGPSKDRQVREPSLGLDLDFGEGVQIADEEGDIQMGDDDLQFNVGDESGMPGASRPDMARARISESPLSDIDENFAKEVELEYSRHMNTDMYEPGDDPTASMVRAPQRQKKKKLLQPDDQTMLSNAQIKEQQAKRDNILKPQSFVTHDPYIVGLLDLHKNGGFVNNILFEGRSAGWAPELKGLLSLGSIRPNELKRKRDSGVADLDSEDEQGASKSPRLELPDDETIIGLDRSIAGNQSIAADGTVLEIPADETVVFQGDDEDERPRSRDGAPASPMPNFDDTTIPIVHPADSGPVSIGTKHAVHILRDLFGADAATNADKRKKTAVVFQELLPEKKTSKADATKMFFECLVLATKDAIKVEQPEGSLGGAIRVRGKRGLWGDWAEREAGGEAAREQQQQNQPESAVQSSAAVAVEA